MRVANFNRQQYADAYKKLHHSYERTQYRNFLKALNAQTSPVSDYIKKDGIVVVRKHLTLLVSKQPMQLAYLKCYTMVGVTHASWIYRKINKIAAGKSFDEIETKSDSPSLFSEYWRKLMSVFYNTSAGEKITNVTETTRNRITKLLDEAEEQNLTLSEQATYVTDQLDDPDFNRDRALVIARTETTAASNYSALLGGASSDYEVGKIWIPIMDANTRPSHAAMDGVLPIGVDELFDVGGSQMGYPGDPAGPPNEVIQCRCCLAMVPLLNASGIPILKK